MSMTGIVGGGMLLGLLVLANLPSHVQSAEDPVKSETTSEKLASIRKTLFTGGKAEADRVAPQLKQIGKQELSKTDRETWVRIAREAAIRQGDRAWLESLQNVQDSFATDMIYTVLLASGQLSKAEFEQAKKTLSTLSETEEINEREKRRILSIRARIAQLEGNEKAEREHVNQLIDHLYLWTKPVCQSCHSNMQDPKAMTEMPITNLWFGERFVELMRKQGDAEVVRKAAEAKLKNTPTDEKARIRLAFALKALNQDDEAEKQFRTLPWASFPDRTLKKPRMMTTFP
ncbi:MAG: hypothetical protein U0798_17385 [Gemmataceae bacterium]